MGRISAWVLLAASVLVAVPGAAVQAQPPPKTLHIAVGIDADTLDPAGQTTTTVANMVDYIYETLLRPDYAGHGRASAGHELDGQSGRSDVYVPAQEGRDVSGRHLV